MPDLEFLKQTMTDVGPLVEDILAVQSVEDDFWIVAFLEVDVVLEFERDTRLLFLSSEIGSLPDSGREEFYRMLLQYNLAARETGGLRMALDESGMNVIVMMDMHCMAITTELLAVVLGNLNDLTLSWREVLNSAKARATASDLAEKTMINV